MGIPLSPWDLPAGVSPKEVGISNKTLCIWSPVARIGWTEQSSPACAAASVAGALNGMLQAPQLARDPCLSRDNSKRLISQKNVVEHYATGARATFEKAGRDLASLLEIQEADLADFSNAIYKDPVLRRALADRDGKGKGPLLYALHTLADVDPPPGLLEAPHDLHGKPHLLGDLEEALLDAAMRATPSSLPTHVAKALARQVEHHESRTLKAVHEYLLAEADLYDLTAEEGSNGGLLPSTSSIGTSRWTKAIKDLAALHGLPNLDLHDLLSSDSSAEPSILVGRDDSEADVDAQWELVTRVVASHTSVLLYHMPDHYSLVHAVREWTTTFPYGGLESPGGRTRRHRQILVGSPGQMPNTWYDFERVVLEDLYDNPDYVLLKVFTPHH